LKRLVVDTIKGSFNLWIITNPSRLGSLEPNVNLGMLQKENEELGIKEDAQQISNGLHEVLMEDLTNIDENLRDLDNGDVDMNALNEVLQAQSSAEVEKIEEEEEDKNEEPDDEVLQDIYDQLRETLKVEKELNEDYMDDSHGNTVDNL
jgi:DNA primase catalytic subunit